MSEEVKEKMQTNVENKPTTNAHARKAHHPFSEKLVSAILIRVTNGESINHICSEVDMPSRSTFFDWVAKDLTIKTRYELAMMLRADLYAEEIIQIADDASGDTYIDDNGIVRINYENIARSKLRVDARKWFASKMNPKKYSDKTVLEGSKENTNMQANFVLSNWDAFDAKMLKFELG